ncbi:MAG: hypothetical protein ACREFW_08210, partial [Rhizomicrobium sp.]
MILLVALLAALALGGVIFAFAGGDERSQKRLAALARPKDTGRAKAQSDALTKRRTLAAQLKEVERNQAALRNKEKPSLRRRLEQA